MRHQLAPASVPRCLRTARELSLRTCARRRANRWLQPTSNGEPMTQSGSVVYLIGAGPGDPGLITVRGMQCLTAADVVLYDHLVHPRLLRHARPDAEKIDVG